MGLTALDHVNIRTANAARLALWYEAALGLERGFRPAFAFPGVWLYLGDRAVVHLIEVVPPPGGEGTLRLEHFAFSATGLARFRARLDAAGAAHDLVALPPGPVDLVQVNLHDADGNHIHIDFPADEARALGLIAR
ncbi:MAG: VOC family protein [Pseudomonadota bacterium]